LHRGAVDRHGDFLDAGCANGLLLETLVAWYAEKEIAIRPHGVDVGAYLAEQGYAVAGRASAPNVSLAWIDKRQGEDPCPSK